VNEHDAIARIKRLSHSINCADEIAEVIERLIKERDEARRELCRIESSASGDPNMTSRAVAADCGWDCFKEDGK
jgi:hypothetical protein